MARIKLVESFSKDWSEKASIEKLPLNESTSVLIEGVNIPIHEGYLVPVWRLDKKNLNERIYSTKLAEKVCKEGKVTIALADHPLEEGSVKDIMSVSKNPIIKNGNLYVETYPVDEAFARKLKKIVELGGEVGVSSSGFGELDEDGKVIEESFELDRWFDFVTMPSYSVYVDASTIIPTQTQESAPKQEDSLKESFNKEVTINSKEENIDMPGEGKVQDKTQAFLEKSVRLNIKGLMVNADKQVSLSEKLEAYEEILAYADKEIVPDLHESISTKIVNLNKEVYSLAEKAKDVDTLNIKVKELSESFSTKESEVKKSFDEKASLSEKLKESEAKYELSVKYLEDLKVYSKKLKEMLDVQIAKANGMVSATEYSELLTYSEGLEAKLKGKTSGKKSVKEGIPGTIYQDDDAMNEEEDDSYFDPETGEYISDDMDSDYEDEYEDEEEDELEMDLYDTEGVAEYYSDLVSGDVRYESVKKEILSCKTVLEAQTKALQLSGLVERKSSKGRTPIQEKSPHADARMEEKKIGLDVASVKRKGWL